MKAFARFAWTVLAVNLAVIVWGAFVRATGSGAGCGQHWPSCRGELLPRSPALETVIELTHRTSSAVALVLVVALAVWARRAFPAGHAARRAALFGVLFIVVEALLGAGLVLFGWVAHDASLARAVAMPLHLTNTLLLLASITLAAAFATAPPLTRTRPPRGAGWIAAAAAATLLVGATGAIAALGDTLFPATTFADGLRQDVASGAHMVLRLRLLHPLSAAVAAVLLGMAVVVSVARSPAPRVRRTGLSLLAIVAVQLCLGALNLALLAPIWLQLTHLLLADLAWVALVGLAAARAAEPDEASARSVAAA
jgi:cytochrome c oxidase assembly protein subunit 15